MDWIRGFIMEKKTKLQMAGAQGCRWLLFFALGGFWVVVGFADVCVCARACLLLSEMNRGASQLASSPLCLFNLTCT